MVWIGIDPGADGAIAIINNEKDIDIEVEVYAFKEFNLHRILLEYCFYDTCCVLENVHAMPGNGGVSMFSFGANYGYIKGVLEADNIKYTEVPPQTWKKYYHLNKDKDKSIAKAKALYPDVSLLRNSRCRTDHDGMAEALLIADYARRMVKEI